MANRINLGHIQGATGATGETGLQGVPGVAGITPHIDSGNGHWFLNNYDTGVTAKGNEWFTGSVNPTAEGVDDDLYLNTTTYDVFKKQNGAWVLIVNIKGEQGIQGRRGEKGDTALTVTIGTVTTGSPSSQASVTNSGTNTDLVLDFVIPRGEKGDKGDNGNTTVYTNGQPQGRVDIDTITDQEIDELF